MTSPGSQPAALERLATGVLGFDTILHGGFLKGGMYLVSGQPGTGKTVLGNQMCFYHVANGGRAVFVTLLTETHARMLGHIRSFSFFDPAPIGDSLYYVSGYQVLQGGALSTLLDMMQRVIRDQKASLLVVDGMAATEESADSALAIKEFLQRLHLYAEANGCTTLLLSHAVPGSRTRPEFTMVDGLVDLTSRYTGMRTLNEIEVTKLRGSNHIKGRHSYEINDSGVVVHPRTEAVLRSLTVESRLERQRLPFGIPGLDQMLHGGLIVGSSTLLYGVPGAGKTTLGLHFLAEGARQNEPCLYFGFFETKDRLLENARELGLEFEQAVSNGNIEFLWQPPLEGNLDSLVEKLLEAVRARQVKRLFIDGASGLREAGYPERLDGVLIALANELRSMGVTTLLAVEMHDVISPSLNLGAIQGISAGAENIMLLRFVELRSQLYRLISIVKMRETIYDTSVREFRITNSGIEVAETFGSAEAILTGIARPRENEPKQ